jgi:serpin B
MTVVLPKGSLDDFVGSLDANSFRRMQWNFDHTEGTLLLPRFKLEYKEELNETLKAIGMEQAFDGEVSNFSGMVAPPEQLKISVVIHKTFVDVNEEGTEAAAVTAVGVARCTSVRVESAPFFMNVNKPFFCAITDTRTNAVVFAGAINEPKQ